jgi:hypothetical protein
MLEQINQMMGVENARLRKHEENAKSFVSLCRYLEAAHPGLVDEWMNFEKTVSRLTDAGGP